MKALRPPIPNEMGNRIGTSRRCDVRSRRYVNENARGPGNARLFEFRKAGERTRREVESRG